MEGQCRHGLLRAADDLCREWQQYLAIAGGPSPQALSNLLDRKPQLLRPLALQLLHPPLASVDPAERLGIDLSSLRTVEEPSRCFRPF